MAIKVREIGLILHPSPVIEGAGVHLLRSIGMRQLNHLDPFLLLDHFESNSASDYEKGFPYHPHRGIETVTLVRKGAVSHSDSIGHHGTIGAGDVQWMTSGSGILHEEMPQVRPEGIAGLQLWLNLPAKDKMTRPRYRELSTAALPELETNDGAHIRVMAGTAGNGKFLGPVEGLAVDPTFIDVVLPAGTEFVEALPPEHTAFAYVDQGEIAFGPDKKSVPAPALVVFTEGGWLHASAGPQGGRFLFAAAKPLREPIARYGPFVMNTQDEIAQTLEELRSGRFIRQEPTDLT
jgi:redox-sensitive bicupin YhaK (pirin superfamily)